MKLALTLSACIWCLAIPAGLAMSATPNPRLIPHGGWSYPRLDSAPDEPAVHIEPATVISPTIAPKVSAAPSAETGAAIVSPATQTAAATPSLGPSLVPALTPAPIPSAASQPPISLTPPLDAAPMEPVPAVTATNTPTRPETTPDPMAPRPDAPIFQLQRDQNTETRQPDAAPTTDGGARYYSIHRQAGRTPDTPRLPDPVYLDALPVELNNLPDTQDLAEPPPPPALMRDAQGRIRSLPEPDTDPSLD